MTHQSISKVSMMAMPAMIAGCLLMSGAIAQAQQQTASTFSQERGCSNKTLVGDYGFAIECTILDANLPIRGLALQHYDGRGHITQVDHVVDGGYPPPL